VPVGPREGKHAKDGTKGRSGLKRGRAPPKRSEGRGGTRVVRDARSSPKEEHPFARPGGGGAGGEVALGIYYYPKATCRQLG